MSDGSARKAGNHREHTIVKKDEILKQNPHFFELDGAVATAICRVKRGLHRLCAIRQSDLWNFQLGNMVRLTHLHRVKLRPHRFHGIEHLLWRNAFAVINVNAREQFMSAFLSRRIVLLCHVHQLHATFPPCARPHFTAISRRDRCSRPAMAANIGMSLRIFAMDYVDMGSNLRVQVHFIVNTGVINAQLAGNPNRKLVKQDKATGISVHRLKGCPWILNLASSNQLAA